MEEEAEEDAEAEEVPRRDPSEKQEPHTVMWGKRFRIFSVDFPLGRIKNHLRFKPPAASSLTSSRKASTTGLSTEFWVFLESMEHQIFGEIR